MKEDEKISQKKIIENNKFTLNEAKTLTSNLKIDLNSIEKDESNFDENNLEDEESLRYDTKYNPVLIDYKNLKSQEQNKPNFYRKTSTLSTTISLNENGLDSFTPKKYDINQNDTNETFSPIFSGRNRFYSTPILDYYDGIDTYFKELNPHKNDYQKSNNYLKKEKFLRGHFPSVDLINLKIEDKNNSNNTSPKLSVDLNLTNTTPINPSFTPKNSSSNLAFHNNSNGNFCNPTYYFGYYSVECKSKNIINYFINKIVFNGVPIIPFTPKNYVKQEKEKKTENKNEKKIDKKNLENSKDIKNKMHTVFLSET